MVLVERGSKEKRGTSEHVGASRDEKAVASEHGVHRGKNPTLSIPAHWEEAHGAKVCAEHLDTQPETMPVSLGSPTRWCEGTHGYGGGKKRVD